MAEPKLMAEPKKKQSKRSQALVLESSVEEVDELCECCKAGKTHTGETGSFVISRSLTLTLDKRLS